MGSHQDAETLLRAHQIRTDGGRHKKALAALQWKAQNHSGAAEAEGEAKGGAKESKQSLHGRVKKGLDAIRKNKAPFQSAESGDGESPFEQAEKEGE